MRVSRTSFRPPRAPWAAAIALAVVLFQALASGAIAHTVTDQGVAQVICTAQGATPDAGVGGADLHIDNKAKTDAGKDTTSSGLPCQDCLTAATAALAPPDPSAALVRYARKAEAWRAVARTVQQHARPPPKPPSRAPPIA